MSLINDIYFNESNADHVAFNEELSDMLSDIGMNECDFGGHFVWDAEIPVASKFSEEIAAIRSHLIDEFDLSPSYWVHEDNGGNLTLVVSVSNRYVFSHTYDNPEQLIEDLLNIGLGENFSDWDNNEILEYESERSFARKWEDEDEYPSEGIFIVDGQLTSINSVGYAAYSVIKLLFNRALR